MYKQAFLVNNVDKTFFRGFFHPAQNLGNCPYSPYEHFQSFPKFAEVYTNYIRHSSVALPRQIQVYKLFVLAKQVGLRKPEKTVCQQNLRLSFSFLPTFEFTNFSLSCEGALTRVCSLFLLHTSLHPVVESSPDGRFCQATNKLVFRGTRYRGQSTVSAVTALSGPVPGHSITHIEVAFAVLASPTWEIWGRENAFVYKTNFMLAYRNLF